MDWPRLFDIRRWTRGRRDVLDEIDEEFAFHLERRAEDLMAEEGLDRDEAMRQARRRFGDRTALRKEGAEVLEGERRAEARAGFVDGLVQDLKTAVRVSSRTPMVTGLALLALALGIGANSAVFSVVDAVLLPELPFPAAERLVQVREAHPGSYEGRVSVTPGNYLAYRSRVDAFELLEAYQFDSWTMTGQRDGVTTVAVSDGFLELLGFQPFLGRGLTPDGGLVDQAVDPPLYENREVLLTHDFWLDQLEGDLDVVGRTVELAHWSAGGEDLPDGGRMEYTVVGVLPDDFQFPVLEGRRGLAQSRTPDMLMPLSQAWWPADGYGVWAFRVVGRLAPDATLARARSQLEGVAAVQRADHPEKQPDLQVWAAHLEELPRAHYSDVLLLLWGAVALILAIACVNVACLLLARAGTRESEFAVRASLGAGRGRLLRQLFTESAALAAVGAALGLGLAWIGVRVGVALFPQAVPGLAEAGLNGAVVAVTLVASVLTVLAFGWGPALLASRTDLAGFLKGTRASGDRREGRLLRALVLGEVALALLLFAGAGLVTRSFVNLIQVDPGFDHERILAVQTSLAAPAVSAYPRPPNVLAIEERILEALEALPGVESVAAINQAPLNLGEMPWEFTVEGRTPSREGEALSADFRTVSQGYFETMGIPLLAGRTFTTEDRWEGPEAPLSVVVNRTAARQWWPGEDPVGRVIYWGLQDLEAGVIDTRYPRPKPLIVRGVVGDVKTLGLDVEGRPQVYAVTSQRPPRTVTYVLRASGDPASLAPAARNAIAQVDSREPEVTAVTPMSASFDRAVAQPRFYAFLIGTLAVTSLLMVLAGVYGVLAFLASRRRHEMGVRKVLGAKAPELVRQILRQGMLPVIAGTVVGLAGVLALGRVVESYLFGIEAHDPVTLAVVVSLVLALSLVATWLPARRASRVDPVESLRVE